EYVTFSGCSPSGRTAASFPISGRAVKRATCADPCYRCATLMREGSYRVPLAIHGAARMYILRRRAKSCASFAGSVLRCAPTSMPIRLRSTWRTRAMPPDQQRDREAATWAAQGLRAFPPRMTRSQPQLATAYAPGAIFTWEGGKGACMSVPIDGAAID